MKRKILFLCTQNSARSQMAEALVNMKNSDKFVAYSAGSSPASEVNPHAIQAMKDIGFDICSYKPKPLSNYIDEEFDFIITLCDKMKSECPTFGGDAIFAHWSIADPAYYEVNEEEMHKLYKKARNEILMRINLLLALPIEKLDKIVLKSRIDNLMDDADKFTLEG